MQDGPGSHPPALHRAGNLGTEEESDLAEAPQLRGAGRDGPGPLARRGPPPAAGQGEAHRPEKALLCRLPLPSSRVF